MEDAGVQAASAIGVIMNFVFHLIKSIGIINDSTLVAQFEDGIFKIYDVRQMVASCPDFEKLIEDQNLFRKVRVEGSGFGIVWDDYYDLSCNEIWENGTTIKTQFDNLIAFSDATELWGLNESTLRKAVSYGKLKVGYDVCNFGKQWVITKDAMVREYGQPNQKEHGLMAAEKAYGYLED